MKGEKRSLQLKKSPFTAMTNEKEEIEDDSAVNESDVKEMDSDDRCDGVKAEIEDDNAIECNAEEMEGILNLHKERAEGENNVDHED